MGKKLSRNAPCPCGSGKEYKHCCIHKDFDWLEMEDGNIGRSIQVSEEVTDAFEVLRQAQIARYGREPERVFEGAPPLEHLEHWTVEAMKKAGVDPALIYAYEATNGLLLNDRNENKVPDIDIAVWETAINEHEAKTGQKATRRRLTDEDFAAIMKNGPQDRRNTKFVDRLPFPPPFAREEWSGWDMADVVEDAECLGYLERCLAEINRSGRAQTYLNMFRMMAHLGGPSDEATDYETALKESLEREFSVDKLSHALESLYLTCKPKSAMPCAAAAFEVLGFIGDFMNNYAEQSGIADELSEVLERINATALLAFIAAVNAELGIQPDIWKA